MTTNTPSRPSYEDDNVSLASTQEEQFSDTHDFQVECILAEKKESGRVSYLLDWSDYPRTSATWEPASNIQDRAIIATWEKRKKEEVAGTKPKFNIKDFNALVADFAAAKQHRKRLRKIKRKRVGIPVSPETSSDESTEAREANEDRQDYGGIKTKGKKRTTPLKRPALTRTPTSTQKSKRSEPAVAQEAMMRYEPAVAPEATMSSTSHTSNTWDGLRGIAPSLSEKPPQVERRKSLKGPAGTDASKEASSASEGEQVSLKGPPSHIYPIANCVISVKMVYFQPQVLFSDGKITSTSGKVLGWY